MPKRVDHEDRRRAIAEAVFEVIGERGYEAASLRDVAAAAGISMGRVQHYFTSKHEMLLFALGQMRERVLLRFQAELASAGGHPPRFQDMIRAASRVLLPVDEAGQQEARVNVAFFSAATVNPAYAQLLRAGFDRLAEAGRAQLRLAAEAGEIEDGLDLDHEAAALFYLTQGLAGPILIGACSPDEALAIIDRQLARIFKD